MAVLFAAALSACTTVSASPGKMRGDEGQGAAMARARVEEGIASYYAASLEGRTTASGEPYRGAQATCAHRTHPFGTKLVVTAVESGRSVICRVNDRGPFVKGRVVDLSVSLAEELGIIEKGLARVRVEVH